MQTSGDEAFNPFSKFEPARYCPRLDQIVAAEDGHKCLKDRWVVPDVYETEIELIGGTDLVDTVARIGSVHYPLAKIKDILSWKGADNYFTKHFQGRIGERVLTLMLDALMQGVVKQARRNGFRNAEAEVLRQKASYRPGKTDIVYFNNDYLLQFDRRTTFRLLKKVREGSHRFRYRQGREGLELTDIDGLAWFHTDGRQGEKYLIVGESKAGNQVASNMWGRKKNGNNPTSNLFDPLNSLYPNHQLVYVLAGRSKSLFVNRGQASSTPYPVLNEASRGIVECLYENGVTPLIMPFPDNVNCLKLAKEYHGKLRLSREILRGLQGNEDQPVVGED